MDCRQGMLLTNGVQILCENPALELESIVFQPELESIPDASRRNMKDQPTVALTELSSRTTLASRKFLCFEAHSSLACEEDVRVD